MIIRLVKKGINFEDMINSNNEDENLMFGKIINLLKIVLFTNFILLVILLGLTSTASAVNSITVISPDNGMNWAIGTAHTISWSSVGSPGTTVKIELLKAGVLNRVITSSTPNDGSYSWAILSTQTLGTDYKIRVTSTTNSAYTDTSNNNFIISSGTSLAVTSANGGENWAIGTTHPISWSSVGSPGTYVKIELLKAGLLNRVITSSTPNDGSFSWAILSTQTLGTDYKIRVTSTTNSAYTDTSNNNFIISSGISLAVTSANGGENWAIGTTHPISWSSVGSPGTYVKIELLKAGLLNRVITSSTPNDGSYSWAILSTQTLGTDYKIRVTSTTNSAYTDTSNNNFIISSPQLLFAGNFETGNLAQWTDTCVVQNDRVQIVTNPNQQGKYAAKFIVKSGDECWSTGNERAEVALMSKGPVENEGKEYYYAWSTFFPVEWTPVSQWGVIMQWHTKYPIRPAISIYLDSHDGIFVGMCTGNVNSGNCATANTRDIKIIEKLVKGKWNNFLVHVKWSAYNKGKVEVWHQLDGDTTLKKVLSLNNISTLQYKTGDTSPSITSKQHGLYRSNTASTQTLYHDGFRIGNSFESVKNY